MMRKIGLLFAAACLFSLIFAFCAQADSYFPSLETMIETTAENKLVKITGELKSIDDGIYYNTQISLHDDAPMIRSDVGSPMIVVFCGQLENDKIAAMHLQTYADPASEAEFDIQNYHTVVHEFFTTLFGGSPELVASLEEQVAKGGHIKGDEIVAKLGPVKDNDAFKFEYQGRRYGLSTSSIGGILKMLNLNVACYTDETLMALVKADQTDSASILQIEKAAVSKGKLTIDVLNLDKKKSVDAFDLVVLAKDKDGQFMRTNDLGVYETFTTIEKVIKPGKTYKTGKSGIKLDGIADGATYYVAITRMHVKGGDTITIAPEQYRFFEVR